MNEDNNQFENKLQDDNIQQELSQEETVQEEPASEEIMKNPPYHERYYLKYCGGQRTAPIDLDGTKSFLQAIGFDGGELRQAREGKGQSEVFQRFDKSKKNQMYCSYCGSEIAGVEYYRMPDGRLRCTSCSRSIVTNRMLFVKLFTPQFRTLFTTIFIFLSNLSSHYITLIMHIKFPSIKMKHIILPECHLCDIRVFFVRNHFYQCVISG